MIYSLSWGKTDMASAASREVPMTKQVVESIEALGDDYFFLALLDCAQTIPV